MRLSDFKPRPQLVTPVTHVSRPRFPVIDAHNHLAEPLGGGWDRRPAQDLLDALDAAGVRGYVDLDGGWGEALLHAHLDLFKQAAPERFRIFGGVAWERWAEHGDGFGEWAARQLRAQARRGAEGLKIWKPFGLHVRDQHGRLAAVDDPRLDPLWATAGELGLPVMIHVADPAAFFDPIDAHNERWEELGEHPDWSFPSPPFPPFLSILEALHALVARHPATTFIGAHVGCYAENLGWVGRMLDGCPNYHVDISARIGELGLPVMIHVADPVAFFDPIDVHNERWEELGQHPDWSFPSPPYPPFIEILNALQALVARHPATTFIGAHVGCYAENLGWVGRMLDGCPNYHVDLSARIGELGRQPYTARRFCLRYADRILFGTDAGPQLAAYRLYYRFLETEDEYFNYSLGEIPRQGRWHIYGLHLPDEVLEKVYFSNAQRLFGFAFHS